MRSTRSSRAKYEKSKKSGNAFSWVLCIVIAVAAAFLIRTFVFEPIQVDGDSMQPTLHSHQSLAVEKVSRYFSLPERQQVVIVHYPNDTDDKAYVKRVIGLPGETIEIKDSTVYINGTPLEENYISQTPYRDMEAVTVPEGCVFVMGDNRANSKDSRAVGCIAHSEIVGNAMFIIWPFDEIGEIGAN